MLAIRNESVVMAGLDRDAEMVYGLIDRAERATYSYYVH